MKTTNDKNDKNTAGGRRSLSHEQNAGTHHNPAERAQILLPFCFAHCCTHDVQTGCPMCQDNAFERGLSQLFGADNAQAVLHCGGDTAFQAHQNVSALPVSVQLACATSGCPNVAARHSDFCIWCANWTRARIHRARCAGTVANGAAVAFFGVLILFADSDPLAYLLLLAPPAFVWATATFFARRWKGVSL